METELTVMEIAGTQAMAEAVTEVRVILPDHLMDSLQQDLTDHHKTMLLNNKEVIVKDLLTLPVQADHQAVAMAAAVVAVADHQVAAAADAVVETKLICI